MQCKALFGYIPEYMFYFQQVAVKVIDKKKAREDAYVRKNLRREGKLVQQVRHRHVVRLHEVMETENSYYMVMELCRGGDLMEVRTMNCTNACMKVVKTIPRLQRVKRVT